MLHSLEWCTCQLKTPTLHLFFFQFVRQNMLKKSKWNWVVAAGAAGFSLPFLPPRCGLCLLGQYWLFAAELFSRKDPYGVSMHKCHFFNTKLCVFVCLQKVSHRKIYMLGSQCVCLHLWVCLSSIRSPLCWRPLIDICHRKIDCLSVFFFFFFPAFLCYHRMPFLSK